MTNKQNLTNEADPPAEEQHFPFIRIVILSYTNSAQTHFPMQYFMNRKLRQIEREANDDLLQVQTLGPQHYSTPELYDLLDQLEHQKKIVTRKFNRVYRIGSFIPVFIIGTFLASYFKISWLTVLFISFIPVLGIYFTLRSMWIRRDHPTYFDSKFIEDQIRQELRRRREESSIF